MLEALKILAGIIDPNSLVLLVIIYLMIQQNHKKDLIIKKNTESMIKLITLVEVVVNQITSHGGNSQ